MAIALVIIAVVAVGLLAALLAGRAKQATLAAQATEAATRAAQADARVTTAEAAREAAEVARGEAETARQEAEIARDEAAEARSAAEAQVVGVEDRVRAAQAQAAAAEQSRVEAAEALARVREVAEVHPQAGGLWVLEAMRIERRWRESVAVSLDRSPFDGTTDPARIAVGVVVDAAREEAGTSFDLVWSLDEPVSPDQALTLVRATEELITAAALSTDGGRLEVHPLDAGGIGVRLRTNPGFTPAEELAAALVVLGATVEQEQGEAPAPVGDDEVAGGGDDTAVDRDGTGGEGVGPTLVIHFA